MARDRLHAGWWIDSAAAAAAAAAQRGAPLMEVACPKEEAAEP